MTYEESISVIRELMAAKSTEDLQAKMGAHMSQVDATFFSTVNQVVARLH